MPEIALQCDDRAGGERTLREAPGIPRAESVNPSLMDRTLGRLRRRAAAKGAPATLKYPGGAVPTHRAARRNPAQSPDSRIQTPEGSEAEAEPFRRSAGAAVQIELPDRAAASPHRRPSPESERASRTTRSGSPPTNPARRDEPRAAIGRAAMNWPFTKAGAASPSTPSRSRRRARRWRPRDTSPRPDRPDDPRIDHRRRRRSIASTAPRSRPTTC